jgi:hypothetical protein
MDGAITHRARRALSAMKLVTCSFALKKKMLDAKIKAYTSPGCCCSTPNKLRARRGVYAKTIYYILTCCSHAADNDRICIWPELMVHAVGELGAFDRAHPQGLCRISLR